MTPVKPTATVRRHRARVAEAEAMFYRALPGRFAGRDAALATVKWSRDPIATARREIRRCRNFQEVPR